MRDHDAYLSEPGNWSDAFKRIPLESPGRDIWSKLASEIRPPARPTAHQFRWAIAAVVATVAIALPLAWPDRNPVQETPQLAAQSPSPVATHEPVNVPPVNAIDDPSATLTKETLPAEIKPARVVEAAANAAKSAPTALVAAIAPDHAARAEKPLPTVDATARGQESIASLYAESAQLEALLSKMQDERVSTGPAAALAGQYASRLATIDASLSDPALPHDRNAALWGERIEVLRELVGFQASQRWLNARGERYDGQWVAVY